MDFKIDPDLNRISIKGSVPARGLRLLCAFLHKAIAERGFSDIILDFSICNGIRESVMLPILPIITFHREQGNSFHLVLPQEDRLKRLFLNTNWAHHIDPNEYDLSSYEGGHVPALRFRQSEDQSTILDRVMGLILSQMNTDRSTLKAIEWSLWEIMDNVPNHAQSPVGGFVQATVFKDEVEFVVSDAGVGIPQSIREDDHVTALTKVINEGVTRDKTQNAGNGLYGSYQVAVQSNGQFEIHSLNGLLYFVSPEDGVKSRLENVPYNGTSVRCRIGTNDHELLGKALRFKGKSFDPPYDYIERKFENDEGEMIFNMREKAWRDFGSRKGGKKIRGMIESLLGPDRPVILDFDGVGVISSSFADEVFGRLFVDMGPRSFMTRIEMRNVDPTVEGLIDRAIVQRTKLGNGNT